LRFDDDNHGIPHGVGGPYADPWMSNYSLPYTGLYTLAVYDVLGASTGPWVYEIHVTGVQGSTIPEPTTMLLLGCGLIAFAGFRKIFKKG
jgi:hypothetical protein